MTISTRKTCSITNPINNGISFIRNENYINEDIDPNLDIIILVPQEAVAWDLPIGPKYIFCERPEYEFIWIHNSLNKNTEPNENIIGYGCDIHPSSLIGTDGLAVKQNTEGKWLQMVHMGRVVIGDNVTILAFVTIQRAIFGSTIIKDGVKIDSHVNIGHHSIIGENTVIACGSVIGGSVTIGKNCMLGLGAIIRSGVSICKDVMIGMGAVVVKDITKPGTYIGNPAKLIRKDKPEMLS